MSLLNLTKPLFLSLLIIESTQCFLCFFRRKFSGLSISSFTNLRNSFLDIIGGQAVSASFKLLFRVTQVCCMQVTPFWRVCSMRSGYSVQHLFQCCNHLTCLWYQELPIMVYLVARERTMLLQRQRQGGDGVLFSL